MSNWAWQQQEASQTEHWELAVDSGTYVLTGIAASTKRNALIPLAAGAYTLTGSTVLIYKGRTLEAARGEYRLTGHSAEIMRDIIYPPPPAPYVEQAWVRAQVPSLDADWTRDVG